LILTNLPLQTKEKKNKISKQSLQKYGAEFVFDVIDASRKNNGMVQRAVEYFLNDKIVCQNFDIAIKL
jgi:hypothetical protein